MKFQIDINIPKLAKPIKYTDKLLLVGSCFTEHISDRLAQHHFSVCSNPNGILFNPLSVADSLRGYLEGRYYELSDLFYLNELWNCWDTHSRFSHINQNEALEQINAAQKKAQEFITSVDWIVITLGSAFQYYLKDGNKAVANNHRAPGQWFEKRLLEITHIKDALSEMLVLLLQKNPKVQVIFTVSPVRHIRDGVVDNNRSKARLIEVVHQLCAEFACTHYFPAYELVIDVLRDYRFYDIDLVHPNFAATSYVWDAFVTHCMQPDTVDLMKEVLELNTARKHLPRFPQTQAHIDFCLKYAAKAKQLQSQYPELELSSMIHYFEQA